MATTRTKRPSNSSLPEAKKPRLFAPQRDEDKPQTAAKVDPTYGQRGAFPGLDDGTEEELFYGPADDGLAYLRMVRLEAKGVPNLLVAPTVAKDPEELDLYAPYAARGEGWYSDGAYTAAPLVEDMKVENDAEDVDPQEAYYTALLDRFDKLRFKLSQYSPSSAPATDPAVRPLLSDPKARHWKHALLKSKPTPTLLCNLPQEYVVLGIEELEALLTMKNLRGGLRHKLGAWAWGLLGRCRDVSEMDSEDVSVLRGLGKKSVALLRRLRAVSNGHGGADAEDDNSYDQDDEEGQIKGQGNQNGDEMAPEHPGTQDFDEPDADAALAEARARLLSGLVSNDTATNGHAEDDSTHQDGEIAADVGQVSDAHATLDMIVTIVGECYGQRDLLDGRLAWEEL